MKLKSLAILLASAEIIAGCSQQTSRPATASITVGSNLAAAEGQAFYRFQAGYKCGGAIAGDTTVASWVDKVEVIEGKLVRWGSRCGGEGLPVPEAERRTAQLSADGSTLTLGGVTYRRSANPAKDAEFMP